MIFGNAKYSSRIGFLSVKRAAGCSSVAEISQGRFRPPHSCAHAHTDRLWCLPSSGRSMEPAKWCLYPSRGSDGCAGHRCCQRALRSKRRWQMEPWNPCDRFFREPRATAANERSRPLLPLSLSRSLSVSRYSAGKQVGVLTTERASYHFMTKHPESAPVQPLHLQPSASVHFICRHHLITASFDRAVEREQLSRATACKISQDGKSVIR